MARVIEVTTDEPKFTPFALVIESEDELKTLYARLNTPTCDIDKWGHSVGYTKDNVMSMFDEVQNKCKEFGLYK